MDADDNFDPEISPEFDPETSPYVEPVEAPIVTSPDTETSPYVDPVEAPTQTQKSDLAPTAKLPLKSSADGTLTTFLLSIL